MRERALESYREIITRAVYGIKHGATERHYLRNPL